MAGRVRTQTDITPSPPPTWWPLIVLGSQYLTHSSKREAAVQRLLNLHLQRQEQVWGELQPPDLQLDQQLVDLGRRLKDCAAAAQRIEAFKIKLQNSHSELLASHQDIDSLLQQLQQDSSSLLTGALSSRSEELLRVSKYVNQYMQLVQLQLQLKKEQVALVPVQEAASKALQGVAADRSRGVCAQRYYICIVHVLIPAPHTVLEACERIVIHHPTIGMAIKIQRVLCPCCRAAVFRLSGQPGKTAQVISIECINFQHTH